MFFCRFKSCESQLTEFVSDIVNNSHAKQTDVIILDFSKTFDYVPHNRPLYKPEYCDQGIRGDTLNWIKAFLENRQQSVMVDRERTCDFVALRLKSQASRELARLLFSLHLDKGNKG